MKDFCRMGYFCGIDLPFNSRPGLGVVRLGMISAWLYQMHKARIQHISIMHIRNARLREKS